MVRSRLLAISLFLLLSGLNTTAIDQREDSKFEKYQNAVHIRQIDWLVLQANVEAVKFWVDGRFEFIETPTIAFNPKTRRMEAFANVDSDEMSTLPNKEVNTRLWAAAIHTGTAVSLYVSD